jgi:xanthine dehydrogenase YagR molybdenum-binding subunit
MGDIKNKDQHINWILTGKMDYYADRLAGKKFYGAIKTSTIARGWIKLSAGGGVVTSFTITNAGKGYTAAPTVTIAGGSGNGATATATVANGAVTAVTVVSGGTNYSAAPRVTFSGGVDLTVTGNVAAAATAVISTRSTPMIDTTAALAEPGVKAVVTYVDVPTWTQGIFQWGQEVAGVVADDWFTAVRACQLITVTYEAAPTVWDVEAAILPTSPLAIPGGNATTGTNVGPASNVTRGDVTAGFAASDVTITRNQPWTTTYGHNMLEPHGTTAWWIGDDAYFWTGSQDIHSGKNAVVNALGLPANKIHAYTHGTGGGHGDKTGAPLATPAVVMSQKVGGYPVQVVCTRNVNNTTQTRQFDTKQTIQLGAKKDGTLVSWDSTGYTNAGRSGSFALAMAGIQNSYTIPNYRHNLYSVNTNAPVRGAWRCVGDPPASQGYDSALDTLAAKLNMDPYALRIKNVRDVTLPAQDGTKLVWGGTAVPTILTTLYTQSGYATKWHAPGAKTLADGRMHGISIVAHMDSHGSVSGATRYLSMVMTADGKILVNVGGARGTDGAETICCIYVAEAMGMTYADVRCGEFGNTDTTLTAGIQAGSGFTAGAGTAAVNLGNKARLDIFRNFI